jgi:hypothetical protein
LAEMGFVVRIGWRMNAANLSLQEAVKPPEEGLSETYKKIYII